MKQKEEGRVTPDGYLSHSDSRSRKAGTHKANPLASGEGSNEAKDMSGLDSGRSEVR